MKIAEYIKTYYEFTGLASTVTRQLVLAGIAVIWIFKSSQNDIIFLSSQLIPAIASFVIFCFFDFLQYVVGSAIWYFYYRYLEIKFKLKDNNEREFSHPQIFSTIINIFFILKLFAAFIGYCFLIYYLLFGKLLNFS